MSGRPEEYFWRDDIPYWRQQWGAATDEGYLAGALREGTTPNGVFGARLMWGYLDEVVALIGTATGAQGSRHHILSEAFPHLRYIHLSRGDRVAQPVSWARAAQTGIWYEDDDRNRGNQPTYDRSLIDTMWSAIEEGEHGWSSFFSEVDAPIHEVTYEELVANPRRTVTSFLEFLGIGSGDVRLEILTQRQSDSVNETWMARYWAERSGDRG